MKPDFGKDFTTGSIPRHLFRFFMPILIGNMVTTGYGIVNAIWVGRLLGGDAVGAILSSFPLIMIVNALIMGFATAASILTARYYGSRQPELIQKAVNCSWTIALIMTAVLTAAGIALTEPMLRALGTQEAQMGVASGFLRISFAGVAFMYLSTLIVAILRGIGDTATPTIFMVLATVINAVLDPLLISGVGPLPALGLNGAAIASLAAMAIATVSGFLYSYRKYRGQPVLFRRLALDRAMLMELARLGLPSFVQQALISVSAAFVVFLVNGFGVAAIDAYGVTSRVDSIAIMPASAMFMAASTLTAQHMGAGMHGRVRDIFKWSLIVNTMMLGSVAITVVALAGGVMGIFVSDADIIRTGVGYFSIVGVSYILLAASFVTNGIINGAGRTAVTMAISVVSLCVVRIPLALALSRTALGLQGVWIAIAASFATTAVLSMAYYLSGRWKRQKAAQAAVPVPGAEQGQA